MPEEEKTTAQIADEIEAVYQRNGISTFIYAFEDAEAGVYAYSKKGHGFKLVKAFLRLLNGDSSIITEVKHGREIVHKRGSG